MTECKRSGPKGSSSLGGNSLRERYLPSQGNAPEILVCMIVCALALAPWLMTLRFSFVYDDHAQIERNIYLRSWGNLHHLLAEPLWTQTGVHHSAFYYRPLFSLWLLLQYSTFDLKSAGWHACSLLLYFLSIVSVYWLARSLQIEAAPALMAAVLFELNPLHAEVVSWISASCEMISAISLILSLACLAQSIEKRRDVGNLWYATSLLLYLLSLYGKETGLFLLPLFVLFPFVGPRALADGGRLSSRNALLALGSLLPVAIYFLTRWTAYHGFSFALTRGSLSQVLLTTPSALSFYLEKLLLPWHLSQLYDVRFADHGSIQIAVLVIALFAGTVSTLLWLERKSKVAFMGVALLCAPIAAAIAGLSVFRDYDLVHDRYLFLPSVGWSLLIGQSLQKIRSHKLVGALTLPLSFAFLVLIFHSAGAYRDDVQLFRRAVEVAPNNLLARGLLADAEWDAHRTDEALKQYRNAQQMRPDDWTANFRLGLAYSHLGNSEEAMTVLRTAAGLTSITQDESALTWYGIGALYEKQGKLPEAANAYRQALVAQPRSNQAKSALSSVEAALEH
jgi:protein O-mannosyl-transferase